MNPFTGSIFNVAGPDIIIVLIGAFIMWMFVDCVLSKGPIGIIILWALLMIFAPLLGSLVYLIFGRKRRRS